MIVKQTQEKKNEKRVHCNKCYKHKIFNWSELQLRKRVSNWPRCCNVRMVLPNEVYVTREEMEELDAIIHKNIQNEILKYWGHGIPVYSSGKEQSIGRIGYTFDDLMQYGRLYASQQLKWFKVHGVKEDGTHINAKKSTLLFLHMRRKFMSLSKSFTSDKKGGPVVHIHEDRKILNDFLNFKIKRKIKKNKFIGPVYKLQKDLVHKLKDSPKELRDKFEKKEFNNIKEMREELISVIKSLQTVSHVSYEESGILEYDTDRNIPNPEEYVLFKEEAQIRVDEWCDKHKRPKMTVFEYIKLMDDKEKTRKENINRETLLMKLAKQKGFKSQSQLARHCGIGLTTLSNILNGHSPGNQKFRQQIEKMFGRNFDELIQDVPRKEK